MWKVSKVRILVCFHIWRQFWNLEYQGKKVIIFVFPVLSFCIVKLSFEFNSPNKQRNCRTKWKLSCKNPGSFPINKLYHAPWIEPGCRMTGHPAYDPAGFSCPLWWFLFLHFLTVFGKPSRVFNPPHVHQYNPEIDISCILILYWYFYINVIIIKFLEFPRQPLRSWWRGRWRWDLRRRWR